MHYCILAFRFRSKESPRKIGLVSAGTSCLDTQSSENQRWCYLIHDYHRALANTTPPQVLQYRILHSLSRSPAGSPWYARHFSYPAEHGMHRAAGPSTVHPARVYTRLMAQHHLGGDSRQGGVEPPGSRRYLDFTLSSTGRGGNCTSLQQHLPRNLPSRRQHDAQMQRTTSTERTALGTSLVNVATSCVVRSSTTSSSHWYWFLRVSSTSCLICIQ